MTVEANKTIVRNFIDAACRRDLSAMGDLLLEGGDYWVAGQSPLAGVKTKDEFLGQSAQLFSITEAGATLEIGMLTAEADRVSVTLRARMTLKDGRPYNNRYHILATLRDGRIAGWEEYFDTGLVDHLVSTYPVVPEQA